MNCRKFALRALLLVCGFSLHSRQMLAQEEPQQEPQPIDESKAKPAGHAPFPAIDPNGQENQDQNDMQADFTPLTGLQNPTLLGARPSIWFNHWVKPLKRLRFLQLVCG
jgi:hypothetical protein